MRNWTSAILLLCLCVLYVGGESVTLEGIDSHVVVGIDSYFHLKCSINGNLTGNVFRYWSNPEDSLIVFNSEIVPKSMQDRIVILNPDTSMELNVTGVMLSDAGNYKCKIDGPEKLEGVVNLSVDKTPSVWVEKTEEDVIENNVGIIGTCHADAAKPAPQIWFENSKGEAVNTYATIVSEKFGPYDLFNTSLTLKKDFTRENNGEKYSCKVKYTSGTNIENYSQSMGKVSVNFPASVALEPYQKNSIITLQEKQAFVATCKFWGNPAPQIVWTFTPDTLYIPPNSTAPDSMPEASTTLPENFYIIDDIFSSKLVSESLVLTEKEMTNNGTFTCTAHNGIGPDVDVSFALSITAIPTTTAPPTTPADTKENISDIPAQTVKPEPQSADAAVIGGVVAVAVFVLIVAVILLVRYFLSHKGEYYTNEIKDSVEVREESEDDDSHNENDILTSKGREEFFM